MISTKPYFLRAIREWALDNYLTPQMLVDASRDDVVVPDTYVNNSQILLNISEQAVNGLVLGNEEIVFSARFGGKPMQVSIPIEAVMAIFTREDGQGIFFESSNTIISAGVKLDSNQSQPTRPDAGAPARLGLAKGGPTNSDATRDTGAQSDNDSAGWADKKTPVTKGATDATKKSAKTSDKNDENPDPAPTSPGRRGRPNLRLVDKD